MALFTSFFVIQNHIAYLKTLEDLFLEMILQRQKKKKFK